jgi:alanyl-tRNA synthetase
MEPLSAAEIRERYLAFFESLGHQRLPSDSLIPADDPTLLFTGAGMNQFKDMFLGKGTLPHKRVTTTQKCLRVPDLDEVGKTPRHHTFFEMLGNFSFGDYFKAECIEWEWEFFTKVLGIPEDRLVVTVYIEDDEAFAIWNETVGLGAERIFRLGEKENFWPASAPSKGPNGPCGPCSEIYYDARPGEPYPEQAGLQDLPGDRFTEIGNCVFTQFDRQSDGSLEPLPQRNIDVGLGLERIAAVLAGVETNFETDLFTPYIRFLEKRSGKKYGDDLRMDQSMRRVSDHVRAVTFCIADGAVPGNEGRGYVVRKIVRRAIRDGYQLGIDKPFLFDMVDVVGEIMGDVFPEVRQNAGQCRALIKSEEESFAGVYRQGMARLEEFLANAGDGAVDGSDGGVLAGSGEFAFQLHDTFGFPGDITGAVMADRGHAMDQDAFDKAMAAQRDRARASTKTSEAVFADNAGTALAAGSVAATVFCGYDQLAASTEVAALVGPDHRLIDSASPGDAVLLVVKETPFYAEGGGQVGDGGTVEFPGGSASIANTERKGEFHLHHAKVTAGTLTVGTACEMRVDETARRATERHHTATHLLHAALKEVLGDHVGQSGSVVSPDRLRFDFTHGEKLTTAQIHAIEDAVHREILRATPVVAKVASMDAARADGFVALFGEKYGDEVRTLAVGEFSRELCGGTHVVNVGAIGAFRIVAETAISAGNRRIEAVAGVPALALARDDQAALDAIAKTLKTPVAEVTEKVVQLTAEAKRLRKELEVATAADLGAVLADLEKVAVQTDAGRGAVLAVAGLGMKDLQELLTRAQQALAPFAGVVLSPGDAGVLVGATVSEPLIDRVKAGDLVKTLTGIMGGGGGGRPESAQGKGRDASKLEEALGTARKLLAEAGLG